MWITLLFLSGLFLFVYFMGKYLHNKECKECEEQEKAKYKDCSCEGLGCICGLKES